MTVELYHSRDGITNDSGLGTYPSMVSLSVMGIVARAHEKFFRAPRLCRMLLFHKLINFPKNYVMIPVCYRNSRTVPRQRKFNQFIRWGIYTGNLIPITSFLASESCLTCKTPSLYPEPPNEPESPSELPHYPGLRIYILISIGRV